MSIWGDALRARVLLVADGSDGRAALRGLVGDAPFRIDAVESLDRAERVVREAAFDAVVVSARDGVVPSAERLQALDVPVVVLTGKAAASRALAAGALDALSDDELSPAALLRAIRFAVERAQRLRERARAHAVVDLAGVVSAVLERDGTVREVDAGIRAVLGVDPDALEGRSAFVSLPPDQVPLAEAALEAAVAQPGVPQPGQIVALDADGVQRHVEYVLRSRLDDPAVGGVLVAVRDITERVEHARQLELQSQLLERFDQVVFVIDEEFRVTYWNPAAERTLGWTFDEVRGAPLLERIVPPEARARALEVRSHVAEHGHWRGELVLRSKAGNEVIISGSVARIPAPAGAGQLRACAGVDVTELRRAQRDLARQRDLTAQVVTNAPIVLFALDEQGVFSLSDGRGLSALRLEPGEVVGTSAFDVYADHPELVSDVRRALAGERFHTVRSVAGRVFETWWAPDGSGTIGVSVDVTELRQAELEHERANERIRFQAALLAAVGQAVIATDLEGRVTYWNHAAEVLYGWSADEAVGSDVIMLTPAEPQRERAAEVLAALARGEPFSGEFPLRRKDGSELTALVTNAPMHNAAGELVGIVGVSTDVTERKRLEAELRQAQKMEAIGGLAGGVAHDFNNLLTAIQGHIELALGDAHDESAWRTDLGEAMSATQRAADLTRQLLAFGRRQLLAPRVLDVCEQVDGMHSMLRRLIPESIALRFDANAVGATVRADPSQVAQVVINLVVNARDAIPNGVGEVDIEIDRVQGSTVDLPDGEYVRLTVRDTGSGIDPEVRDHIFEPFFTTKAPGQGTGLGLATVFGIVEQSGGRLLVDSVLGEGSAFHVLLPRVDAAPDAPDLRRQVSEVPTGSECVLVVEDDAAVRKVTTRCLRKAGYDVLEASSGREALDVVAAAPGRVRLVISDVVMPEMSGPELLRTLRREHPGVAFVLTSGYATNELDGGAVDLGVPFLRKPFTIQEVSQVVRSALDA